MKKVGVVTITYNGADVIGPFLECMLRQSYGNFILYIIDNNSQDDTLRRIGEFHDGRIRLVNNKDNVGVAGGNNIGIKLALEQECDYIWILNNDVEFEDHCLQKLVEVLDSSDCGLVTHKMMYYYDKSLIWYAGSHFNKWKGNIPGHRGMKEKDTGKYDRREIVHYTPTCSVLVKREVFEEVGLMDESYFAYFDDTDFLFRVYKSGVFRMIYLPDVEFYHKVGAATKSKEGGIRKFKFGDFHIRLSTRNRVYYLRKQRSFLAIVNAIYFYFWLVLRFLLTGKYHRNLKTLRLIHTSYREGWKMRLPDKERMP